MVIVRGSRNRKSDKPATRGRVLSVDRSDSGTVVVQDVNIRVGSTCKRSQQNPQGGRRASSEVSDCDMSNVLLFSEEGKAGACARASK